MVKQLINPAIGEIEFTEDQIIYFDEGMLGLPNLKEYLLLESPDIAPFLRLQNIEEPKISFLLVDPDAFDTDYKLYVNQRVREEIIYDSSNSDTSLLVVVNITQDGADISANMVAPVALDLIKKKGQQFVLIDSPYSVRTSLVANDEQAERKGA